MTRPVDIKDVVAQLNGRVGALAREFFPKGRFDRRYCQVGSLAGEPGQSLVIYLDGARQGRWSDYATGEFGDALDLVAQVMFGGPFMDNGTLIDLEKCREAVQWSLHWLGYDTTEQSTGSQRRFERTIRDPQAAIDEAEKNRNNAFGIWLAGRVDLTDTPVARYLAGRGIDLGALPRPPHAIRCHPDLWHVPSRRYWPAMVTAIADANGRFLAVHRTWLEICTDGSVRKAPVEPNKMVLAAYHGGFIRLARGASDKSLAKAPDGEDLWIAEGIEDGLTTAIDGPELRVVAAVSLANLGNLEVRRFHRLHLMLQDDKKAGTLAQRARAIAALQAKGHEVWLHKPWRFGAVKDINELAQRMRTA